MRDVEGELAVVGEMGGEVVGAGIGRVGVRVGEEVKGRIGVRVRVEAKICGRRRGRRGIARRHTVGIITHTNIKITV